MFTTLIIVAIVTLVIAVTLKRTSLPLVNRRLAVWVANMQRTIVLNRLSKSTAQLAAETRTTGYL